MDQETIDDTQESTTDEAVDETTTEESSNDDVETLKAELSKTQKIAQDQRGRAEKAEAKLKAKSQSESTNQPSDEKYERLDLKTDGYKAEEVDMLMEIGGRKALENPLVKEAIAVMRRKSKSQEATPSGTAKSPIYQKFTERDLRNMPLAELEKIIPQGD